MTTIAYKNGVIAADSGEYEGDTLIGLCAKVFRHNKTGILGGSAGHSVDCQRFQRWLCRDPKAKPPEFIEPESQGFIAYPNGKLEFICSKGRTTLTGTKFYAIGSGYQLALGAMAAGATAEQAVRIAAQYNAYTHEPVLTLKHGL